MKRILIILFLIWWSTSGSYAQDNFTLSLELVKLSGKIDSKSYFLARLKNHNDSLSFFVGYRLGGYQRGNYDQSYMKIIFDRIGEPEYTSNKKAFFGRDDEKAVLTKPLSEFQVKLSLFEPLNALGDGYGILPRTQFLRKIKRVRIKLEKFEFTPLHLGAPNPKPFYPLKSIDLYSNWINIDGETLMHLLEEQSIKAP